MASTNNLYINYLNSFLKVENYTEYPIKTSYIEQIAWLYANVKKPREVFLAKVIINNYLNKSNLGIVYELDATSSGIQLVSLLMKSTTLGKISNVVGDKYIDIYKIFSNDFIKTIASAKAFINALLNELNMSTVDELIKEDRITDISKVDTLGKSIKYFLYCSITELSLVKKNIEVSVNKLINNKQWNYIELRYPNDLYWMFNTQMKEFNSTIGKGNTSYFIKLLSYEEWHLNY